ncbi:hypothetical protein [Kitasatospora sp. NPDC097643]|uniref:hypothetical protein n=1 Tax=Kitasatospora sp. NPDC097643 TaxID=3157230 RepID=UPI00331B227A
MALSSTSMRSLKAAAVAAVAVAALASVGTVEASATTAPAHQDTTCAVAPANDTVQVQSLICHW